MNKPTYDIITSEKRLRYEFVSVGPKGNIQKVVEYTYLDHLAIWNLGFGDFNPVTGKISDDVVSDNGDGRKVITTVALTLLTFLKEYADQTVIFTGTDARRTSLYARIISEFYDDFSDQLVITGLSQEGIEVNFETGNQYAAFIIRKVS